LADFVGAVVGLALAFAEGLAVEALVPAEVGAVPAEGWSAAAAVSVGVGLGVGTAPDCPSGIRAAAQSGSPSSPMGTTDPIGGARGVAIPVGGATRCGARIRLTCSADAPVESSV
jgi:hypothetical protein